VFLHQLVAQLLQCHPDEVEELILIDLKGGVEFRQYAEVDERAVVVWKFDDVVSQVQNLVELMELRFSLMVPRGLRAWPGQRVFFVVDEFAQIQLYPVEGKEGREVHQRLLANLNRLSMLGRAAGIVICAAIQKATTDVMDSSFRTNLQGQVCFRVPNRLAAASMFGSVDELMLDPIALPRGQFIFYDPTIGETRYLQAHVMSDEVGNAA
jgi:DNA segregation ATPase FtsK/SpoIIIE-like protein